MTQVSLIRPLRAGVSIGSAEQRQACAPAFERSRQALHRFVLVRVGWDCHLADDLLQQLWMNVYRDGQAQVSEAGEGYLFRAAANLVRAHWRKVRTRPAHLPLADSALAAELADRMTAEDLSADWLQRREVQDQLVLAMTALPSADQDLLIGYYFRGHAQSALAVQLGISERAVEGRLYRARASLRAKLLELDPEGIDS